MFRFVNWLRQFAAGFQLYVGMDESAAAPHAPVRVDPPKGPRGGGPKGAGKQDANAKAEVSPKADAKTGATPKPADNPKEAGKPRKKLGCLKYGDNGHRVVDCPKAVPGEA